MLNTSDDDTSSYLKRSIDNKLKDTLKRDFKWNKYEYAIPFNELENLEDILACFSGVKASLEEAFDEIVKVLTRKQKEVMKLIYLDGLEEKEIAQMLHVKRQDINALKNRAKKTIKANLTLNTYGTDQRPVYEAVI